MKHHGWKRWVGAIALVAAACGSDDGGGDDERTGSLEGQVVVAGPLRGAKLSIDQLHIDNNTGDVREHVADLVTDDDGRWSLPDTGLLNGLILVTATGGEYLDRVSNSTIVLDDEAQIRGLFDVDIYEERFLLVSPVSHLTEALARARLAAGNEPNLWDAREKAAERVDRHFGAVDWARIALADIAQPATSPTEEVRAAAVHAAWPVLADDLRAASGATPQEVHVYALMMALATDIAHPPWDGNDDDSRVTASGLQLGVCDPVPTDCAVPDGDCGAACRSLCDLYSGTLRADFSGAMTKMLRAPSLNGTGLVNELVPVARAMATNNDDVLFGTTCTGGLDRLPPTITWTLAPAEAAFVSGQIDVRVRADDDIDPEVRVAWDGFDDSDQDATNNVASLLLDTGRLVDGTFTITAVATDQAGNMAESSRSFQADNTDPTVSIASTGFVVTDAAWWTANSGPTLTGEASDANGVTVAVTVNAASIETTLAGGTWTAVLPAGTLREGRNTVRVSATDAAGNVTVIAQELGVDTTPPVINVGTTTMADEQGDQINLAGARPAHMHGAASVSLGLANSCTEGSVPQVYRHAYLMVASPPADENNPNALRFVFAVRDGVGIGPDRQAAEYRVRVPGSEWGAWRSAGEGVEIERGVYEYTAALLRTELPELATVEGQYEIEMRSRDEVGLSALQARCWGHHPLAPPLKVTALGQSDDASRSLRQIRLDRNDNVSAVLTGSVGTAWLVEFEIINPTTDDAWTQLLPATLPIDARIERDWRDSWVVLSRRDVNEQCGSGRGSTPTPAPSRSDGVLTPIDASALNIGVKLYELSGGSYLERPPVQGRHRIEAATASGPRRYKAVLFTGGIPSMRPWSGSLGEVTLPWIDGSTGITGELVSQSTHCTRSTATGCPRPPGEPQELKCTQRTTYQRYRAVEKAVLHWDDRAGVRVSGSVVRDGTLRDAKPDPEAIHRGFDWTTTETGLPAL
jgi:hypothetical protein